LQQIAVNYKNKTKIGKRGTPTMTRKVVSLLLAIAMLVLPVLATSCNFGGGETTTTPAETTPETTTPAETTPGENTDETTPGENADATTPGTDTPVTPPVVEGKEVDLGTEEITIVFYHTMGESLRAVLDKYIVEFNQLYPNIKIEHKQVGGYDDVRNQIQTEITVGDQPNIAYCYPDHVALYNIAKAVQTLDGYIESIDFVTRADGTTETIGLTEKQIGNFIDGYYEEGRAFGDGKMYTLPMSKSTEVLYYNKTFFEANNLQVPTTWDELEAVCAQIKAIDPTCIPLGYDSEANWFITMCEQLGSPYTSATKGQEFLFNNQVNRDFVARFRNWYELGYVTTQEISGGYTSALFTMDPSEVGNCYMCIGSSAGANHQIPKNEDGTFKFEVGIVSVPQANAAAPKVISQGPSLCVFKKADSKEVLASWLFVKFLTTNLNFQAEFGMTSGYIPVLENVTDNPVYAEELDYANGYDGLALLATLVALEQADAYYTSPAFNGSSAARDEVGKLIQFCLIDPSCSTPEGILAAFEQAVAACKYQIGAQ
jgi:multiple sugar transport system substrate-binding protein